MLCFAFVFSDKGLKPKILPSFKHFFSLLISWYSFYNSTRWNWKECLHTGPGAPGRAQAEKWEESSLETLCQWAFQPGGRFLHASYSIPQLLSRKTSSWSSKDYQDRSRDHPEFEVWVPPGSTCEGCCHYGAAGGADFVSQPGGRAQPGHQTSWEGRSREGVRKRPWREEEESRGVVRFKSLCLLF